MFSEIMQEHFSGKYRFPLMNIDLLILLDCRYCFSYFYEMSQKIEFQTPIKKKIVCMDSQYFEIMRDSYHIND